MTNPNEEDAVTNLIECQGVGKTYWQEGDFAVPIFHDLDLSLATGEFLSIVGPSGSGKSTLLHLMAGLDQPSAGNVLWLGRCWQEWEEAERAAIRSNQLGFVYQSHHLLSELTALENVAIPLQIKGQRKKAALSLAKETLSIFDLGHRLDHFPSQLSGGERQRVAIARALVHQPQCVLADEPTGNLDEESAQVAVAQLIDGCKARGAALVMVTHNLILAQQADRMMRMAGGSLHRVE